MSLRNREVLVVEDDPSTRALLRRVFESVGMSVRDAPDAADALSQLGHATPHLLVADLGLPGTDGFDLLDLVRSNPALKRMKKLVLTGRKDAGSVERAFSLGAEDYVLKPVHAPQLLKRTRKLLRPEGKLCVEFDHDTPPLLNLSIPASIVKINEISLLVECAAKLQGDEQVNLKSPVLSALKIDRLPLRSSVVPGQLQAPGRFANQLTVIGISEEGAACIRKAILDCGRDTKTRKPT